MAFQLAQRMSAVMLMVPACPESGFLGRPARPAASTIPHESAAAASPHAPPSRGPLIRTMCAKQSRQSQQPHELRYRPEAAPAQTEK